MMMMFKILLSLACVVATSSAVAPNNKKHNVKQILFGILEGAFEHEIDLAKTCIIETAETAGQIDEAIADIEQGTEESTKEGIELLGQAIHELITVDLADCELAEADFDVLAKMAQTLAHPLSFFYHAGKNIVVNRVEIAGEVKTAMEDWRTTPTPRDYDFGYNVGEAMKLVLVGTELLLDEQMKEEGMMAFE